MQHTTEIGLNHTGLEVAPEVANRMMENTDLTKPPRGDQRAAAKLRAQYAAEADPVDGEHGSRNRDQRSAE